MRPISTTTTAAGTSEVLPVPHYSYELPSEEEERFEKLFKQLDVNGDGRIDVLELSESLHKHGVPENLKESYATVSFLLSHVEPRCLPSIYLPFCYP